MSNEQSSGAGSPCNATALLSETKLSRTNKKRPKLGQPGALSIDEMLVGWSRCCFLVEEKKRLCSLQRATGSTYCGTHRPSIVASSEITAGSTNSQPSFERVPCPIDPSHSIPRDKVEAHIRVCNVKVREDAVKEAPYYRHDCNSAGYHKVAVALPHRGGDNDAPECDAAVDPDALATMIHHIFAAQCCAEANNEVAAQVRHLPSFYVLARHCAHCVFALSLRRRIPRRNLRPPMTEGSCWRQREARKHRSKGFGMLSKATMSLRR
jgi:CCCH zinc finger in TRM13 protein/U11-48K-like CHHC zinc finger